MLGYVLCLCLGFVVSSVSLGYYVNLVTLEQMDPSVFNTKSMQILYKLKINIPLHGLIGAFSGENDGCVGLLFDVLNFLGFQVYR